MAPRITAILTVIFFFLIYTGRAQDYRFGLGVRLSNASPTLNNSVTAKYVLGKQKAVEGLVSFGNRFGVGTLFEVHQAIGQSGLYWFYGGGVYFGFENKKTYTGPTGILGLDYKFPSLPLNLSIDVKPELDILPEISFIPDAFSLSARFVIK